MSTVDSDLRSATSALSANFTRSLSLSPMPWSCLLHEGKVLVDSGPYENSNVKEVAVELFRKQASLGWDTHESRTSTLQGLRFHVYKNNHGKFSVYVFCCVFDKQLMKKSVAQAFLAKTVAAAQDMDLFRSVREADTSSAKPWQRKFQHLLRARMIEASENAQGNLSGVDEDLCDHIVERNRQSLKNYPSSVQKLSILRQTPNVDASLTQDMTETDHSQELEIREVVGGHNSQLGVFLENVSERSREHDSSEEEGLDSSLILGTKNRERSRETSRPELRQTEERACFGHSLADILEHPSMHNSVGSLELNDFFASMDNDPLLGSLERNPSQNDLTASPPLAVHKHRQSDLDRTEHVTKWNKGSLDETSHVSTSRTWTTDQEDDEDSLDTNSQESELDTVEREFLGSSRRDMFLNSPLLDDGSEQQDDNLFGGVDRAFVPPDCDSFVETSG